MEEKDKKEEYVFKLYNIYQHVNEDYKNVDII